MCVIWDPPERCNTMHGHATETCMVHLDAICNAKSAAIDLAGQHERWDKDWCENVHIRQIGDRVKGRGTYGLYLNNLCVLGSRFVGASLWIMTWHGCGKLVCVDHTECGSQVASVIIAHNHTSEHCDQTFIYRCEYVRSCKYMLSGRGSDHALLAFGYRTGCT